MNRTKKIQELSNRRFLSASYKKDHLINCGNNNIKDIKNINYKILYNIFILIFIFSMFS
jgi:hypothetical protein